MHSYISDTIIVRDEHGQGYNVEVILYSQVSQINSSNFMSVNMIVNIVQVSLTFLTAVILYLTLVRSLRTLKENKIVDVMLRCQERYDYIVWNYKQTVRNTDINEIEFYDRFWELQVEQFQYWRKGYISDEIYECWMYQRQREWVENKILRSLSYQDGWKKICGLEVKNVFTQFMNLVFSGNISEAMKRHKAS